MARSLLTGRPERMRKTFLLAVRFLLRDWRAGELGLLALALLICVASITTVAFFIDRVEQAINQQSSELLAADFVISSRDAIDEQRLREAQAMGLTASHMKLFRSVLVVNDKVQLVEAKVVDAQYPLRGKLLLSDTPYGESASVQGKPASGEVWVEPRLLQAMELEVGNRVELGARDFVISNVISYEPDRGGDFFRMAPRVMLSEDDLQATQLVQQGSRITHRLLLAGTPEQVAAFARYVNKNTLHGEEYLSVKDGRPEIRVAFERASFFLNIVALISVLLGSIATAMAAQRYTRRHVDTVAILRTTGLTQWRIFGIFLLEMLLLALIVCLLGSALGYLAQYALTEMMANLILTTLPQPGFTPVLVGALTGLIALLGFVLPPLWLLKNTPPIRVLRRDQSVSLFNLTFVVIFIGAIFVLWVWRLGQGEVTQYILAGSLATLVALFVSAKLVVYLLKPVRGFMSVSWRYGLANIARRSNLSAIQVTAFGLGIMFILLNSLVRNEMLESWRGSLPEDVPNYFMTNVQQDQIAGLTQFFNSRSIEAPEFAPMSRGRLLTINDQPVRAEDYEDRRAKNLILRDFNLSWNDELRAGNTILKGRWWTPAEQGQPYLSLDQSVASAFKLSVGDRLRFDVAGTEYELELLNIRGVNWDSFQVNFFAVTTPGLLDGASANWVSSMHLDTAQAPLLAELVRQYPNITIIDIDVIIERIRTLMERVAAAVEYLLVFTLIIGVIIMLTALQTTQDERRHEAALLHTLGARRKWIMKGVFAEFLLMGMIAGAIAGLAAVITAHFLASGVFNFDYTMSAVPVLVGLVAGGVLISVIGLLGTSKVLAQPPIDTFRRS